MQSVNQTALTVKIDSLNKIKRVRDVPSSFDALKLTVEAQLKDNEQVCSQPRNYSIQYRDAFNDLINISDDDDLLSAYETAAKDLQGNLKLTVNVKAAAAIVVEETKGEVTADKKAKKPKKVTKDKKTKEPKEAKKKAKKAAAT